MKEVLERKEIMIKKSMKKALAFTLAASMTFGFSPIALPASGEFAIAAEAGALSNATSVTLVKGNKDASKDTIYQAIKADKLGTLVGATATASVADKEVVLVGTATDPGDVPTVAELNAPLTSAAADAKITWGEKVTVSDSDTMIFIKALKTGSTSVKLEATDGDKTSQTIPVTVSAAEVSFKVVDKDDKEIENGGSISVVAGQNVTAKIVGENMKTNIDTLDESTDTSKSRYVIGDKTVASKVSYSSGLFTFKGEKAGATNVILYLNEDNIIFTFSINVIADTELSATIGGETYTSEDGVWDETPVIYLTQSSQSAKITASSTNGKPVTFEAAADEKFIVVGNDGSIDAKLEGGKVIPGETEVTLAAAANEATGQSARSAKVKVVVTPDVSKLVSLSVSDSEGSILGKSAAKVTGVTTAGAAKIEVVNSEVKGIKLSSKDKTSESIGIDSNVDAKYLSVSSSDEDVFTYKDGVITAVGAGTANLVITASPDAEAENYPASVTIPVTVSDKYISNEIEVTGAPIILTSKNLTGKVVAKATHGNTLSYSLARKNGKEYEDIAGYSTDDVTFNATTQEITYRDNGQSGTVYVKVSGAANDESEAPETVYVEVQYGALKDSDLTVASKKVELKAGESVSAGASVTGQALSYISDNEAVASVSEDGMITAKKAGIAVITVTAEGNGVYKSAEKDITVIVTENESPAPVKKLANTIKVTAKTATIKFAKLQKNSRTLKVSKVLTIKKAKGTKTFIKVSGNKKIKISKKTGLVTVKMGLKKGTYKVKVSVTAAGNATYKAKTVTKTFKIKVVK